MTTLRSATTDDWPAVLRLWSLAAGEDEEPGNAVWVEHARAWFVRHVDAPALAVLPVVEVDGAVVATAVGNLEPGVPNPHSPRGRGVRLANVATLPDHRGRGHATRVVAHVVEWARTIGADRVDLSASPDGQRLYAALGFVTASAPRMKLVL